MGEELAFVAKYTPALIYFAGAIIIIAFTRNYLFKGMVSIDLHQAQILREQQIVTVQEKVAASLITIADKQERISVSLADMVDHLGKLTMQITDKTDDNTDRIKRLEKLSDQQTEEKKQ